MKTKILARAIGVTAMALSTQIHAFAQTAQAPLPTSESATKPTLDPNETYRFIPVQNVPAEVIAWWIDPNNQPQPEIFRRSQRVTELYFQKPAGPRASTEAKPDTKSSRNAGLFEARVRSLMPLSQPRGLLVAADEKQLEDARKIVEFLDKPVRRVQVEITLARLKREDLKQLGAHLLTEGAPNTSHTQGNATPPIAEFAMSVGFTRVNSAQILQRLQNQKRAQIRTYAPVILWNNLTARLESNPALAAAKAPFHGAHVVVTPTVNTDQTITFVMQWGELPAASETQTHKRPMLSVVNLRDGDTVVLGRPSQNSKEETEIALISARQLEPIAMPDDAN